MKIIFYSSENSVKRFFSSIEVEDAVFASSVEDVEKAFSSSDHSIIFLDFDCEELNCTEFLKELNAIEKVNTVLISGKMSLKDILDFQNSSSACDAYLTKPLSADILMGVINDFEVALGSINDNADTKSNSTENVDLTFVGVKKELLDELRKTSDLSAEEIEAEENDISEEDIDPIDFTAGQMEVAAEVRDVIDSHRSNNTNFENSVNIEIQRKFDAVFERDEVNESNEEFNITPQGFEENKVEDNNDAISFNLDSNETAEPESDVVENSEIPLEEVSMSDDNDSEDGLEFNIPVDDSEDVVTEENNLSADAPSDENLDFGSDDGGGLEFNLGSEEAENTVDEIPEDNLDFSTGADEDLNLGADDGAAPIATEEDDSDISFDDNSEELSLGEDISSNDLTSHNEDEGLSFDDTSGDGLSLGGDSNPDVTESDSSIEASNTDLSFDEDDGLSFDEEEIGELDLSESYDSDPLSAEDNSGDDLDFSTETETEPEASLAEVEKSDSSFEMGTDTSNDIESTISSIVAPAAAVDENSTGEFDLSAAPVVEEEEEFMEEFDYKTSSGISTETIKDEFEDLDSGAGENTNPTVIANTSTLNASDFESLEEDSTDGLVFGESTDEHTVEMTETAPREVEAIQEKTSFNEEKDAPHLENLSRNYDEDEMLRLQGTIRQLREERESLMENINTLSSEKQLLSQDNLGLKAELDEVKIELEIVKKRSHDEVSEMKYQMNLSHEKKDVYEMKYKTLYKEFDRLNQKVRIDFNQVKQREKELESKLELVVMDSDSQVQTRDTKILELKRKIDSLEFNMENTSIREQKHREDKSKLETRLAKIMKTLRGSIQLIEDDLEVLETDNTNELDKN